jgi:hypothetical protein
MMATLTVFAWKVLIYNQVYEVNAPTRSRLRRLRTLPLVAERATWLLRLLENARLDACKTSWKMLEAFTVTRTSIWRGLLWSKEG